MPAPCSPVPRRRPLLALPAGSFLACRRITAGGVNEVVRRWAEPGIGIPDAGGGPRRTFPYQSRQMHSASRGAFSLSSVWAGCGGEEPSPRPTSRPGFQPAHLLRQPRSSHSCARHVLSGLLGGGHKPVPATMDGRARLCNVRPRRRHVRDEGEAVMVCHEPPGAVSRRNFPAHCVSGDFNFASVFY